MINFTSFLNYFQQRTSCCDNSQLNCVQHKTSTKPVLNQYSGTTDFVRVAASILLLLTFACTNAWGEDITITPIYTGSYLSPGNLVKVTMGSNTSVSSSAIQVSKNTNGSFTITANAPGMYLKSATFTDTQHGSNKAITNLACTNGSITNSSGTCTYTANASTTSTTISFTGNTGGTAKLGSLQVTVTNGSLNNMETLSGFSCSSGTFSFTAKINNSTVTSAVSLTTQSSSSWGASDGNMSIPSSNDSKTLTITSSNNIRYIAILDNNCRLTLVEKSSTGGTCNGASWTAPSGVVNSVTFKNGISTSLTAPKVFVITESSCPTPTATRGGTEATPAGGVALGTVLEPLTCTATGTSVTYQWKQNTVGSKDGAVNAVGTGVTTASFVPNPAAAGSYWYYCVVTDACSNTVETSLSGMFQFNEACTAPNHVDISGRWDRFAGETISLTATAYSSAGTGSPIEDGNITGWQWQKLISSTWTNVTNGTSDGVTISGATTKNLQITNCGAGNSGKYRCVVSTGATCSTASATATDGSEGHGVKVYVLECYNDGTKTCSFTRTGDSQAGTATLTLAANTAYTFKFHVDNTYYGNNASINTDITNYVFCNSDNGGTCASNFTVNSGLGGTFTFAVEYSTGGNSSVEGEPELSVTYPRKTMYLVPNSDWLSNSAKFAFYYYGNSGTGWTDFLTANDCGMSADIPQWNGLKVIGVRFNSSKASTGNWDDKWNQTDDITVTADKDLITITGWNNSQTYGTYSIPTYTISYNAGTGGSGSKANETKTCGVDFTLPSSAVFTRTGYTQTGWTTSDGAAQTHALGGSYTTNAAQTFYPVWTAVPVSSITVSPSSKTLEVGGTQQLTATVSPDNALDKTVTWSTSNGSIATVNASGLVTAVAAGSCTITATANDGSGKTGTCSITVTEPIVCAISSCGNATLTYAINVGSSGSHSTGGADLISSATASNTTALGVSTTPTYQTITMSDLTKKAAATTNDCYPSKPNMTGKIGCYNGASYSSTNYLQFTFTVKSGYTFTPCDIQFVVQPVSNPASFRWEVTDGTNVYGYGTAADVAKGSDGGASVLTGLSSTSAMNPGTYYIRLYPYRDGGNTFRLGTDVILKGTTAAKGCTDPVIGTQPTNQSTVPGGAVILSCLADKGSYQWYNATNNTAAGTGAAGTAVSVGLGYNGANWTTPAISTEGTYSYYCVVTDGDCSVTSNTVTITIAAAATYTVTYDGNDKDGGSVPVDASSPYTSGSTVTVLGNTGSLTRTIDDAAATFYGWNTNSSGYGGTHYEAGNTFSITANTTLYAEWGYPITYNTDGGTINDLSYPTHYIYTGTSACTTDALPTNVTKSGYTFDGWYTENGAGSLVTCIEGSYTGAFSGDYALKAKWSEADGCEELVHTEAATATTLTTSVGSATLNSPSSQSNNEHAVKLNSSGYIELSPKAGKSFAVGDSLIVVVYNQASSTKTTGYKINGTEYEESVPSRVNHTMRKKLVAADIVSSKVKIERENDNGSSTYFVAIIIKHCEDIPTCTTPVIPSLSDQTVCPGSDIAAWNATVSNAAAITAAGEDVAYSWKKKGSDVELATTASFDLGSSATGGQAGTYVVKVTVSKAGCANATASAEVDLTVTPATEEPSISSNKAKVYEGDAVTLTASCGSTGVTYAWYTCAVDGTSAVATGSTSNTQSIASAPAAGTYYYKVVATGDGTHSCGFAEYIYTLVVSAPSECETYVWWEEGAPTGQVQATCFTFGATPSGSNNQSLTMTIDGTTYTSTKRSSDWNNTITFTIPTGSTGTFYICGKGTGARTITLTDTESHTSTFSMTTTFGTFHSDELAAGTWTVTTNGNLHIGMIGLHVCHTSTCTDATPTITAVNATVCTGTKMRIDATGYETGATFQWQKLNGSTWDNISGATLDSLVIASAAAANAGSYRLIATKECARTSNTVTIAVPSVPVFGDVPSSVTIMQTIALSISTVEASDAVKYRWYKSADATWDAGDTEIGTEKNLVKAYADEAIGSPSYYVFCRAQNSCGITTSSAIAINVIAYVEEDCATRGNEGDAEFGFVNTSMSSGTYDSKNVWYKSGNSSYLTYTAPDGKYFKTAKVTIASSNSSNASYQWSTDGSSWTAVTISSLTTTLTEKVIDLSAKGSGRVTHFRIGRNLDGAGASSGTFYLHKACFEYTESCTSTTVTPSTASVAYTMGGAWSNPTFSLSPAEVSGETLTYSSSNEDIATVDDDGTVNFQGMAGTVTITASYAGGTISATEYCASSGSYTITVSCSAGAPQIVVTAGSTNLTGCGDNSATLSAKTQGGGDFSGGSYQWFRNGEEIDGATSSSYVAKQAGTYTVEYTKDGCTSLSTNSIAVTSETTEPEVERLVPFQYYHVDKTYSDFMKLRHLFAVKNSGTLDGKSFKLYVSRNNGAATDVTSSNALVIKPNGDGRVDTVMIDLNKLSGKYAATDELVYTCKAIDCEGDVSETYKNTIQMHVIGSTPTLALICSGANGDGTRSTKNLVVGGDFLTGYNKADLCLQTGNTSFDASTEWGLYTELKEDYIVTPVNGYAPFNKLNYEPFDILFLTDYPKASKSDAAATILDDMAALCDYRPLFSFKTHMVAKSPSKWAAKGFTTSPVADTKNAGKLNLNIVCYAHPMFDAIKTGDDVYTDVENTSAPLVYTMLSGEGHEGNKGMQGFEIAAAENFVTIGLTHHDATITYDSPNDGDVTWSSNSGDRMLVTAAERQTNIEARMILFSVNAGAQSKLTDKGEQVVLACLRYLLDDDPLHVADCSFTFDNGASNEHDAAWYAAHCSTCTGTKGDGKWSTAANWAPDYRLLPGEFTSVRIAAPVTVDIEHAHVLDARIKEGGHITIPAGKGLEMKGTLRRFDGSEISPTESTDIYLGSTASGNGSLVFNNDKGDTKAVVAMYTTAKADTEHMSAATSTWQYIGTPHNDVAIATYNYYDSWLYQYDTGTQGWIVIPNGGPLVPFRGYCVTHPQTNHTFEMYGTLAATGTVDIDIPANKYVVVANSWVAPIDINALTNDDFEGITDKSIYFFNTGSDTEGSGTSTTSATGDARWATGTYVAVPIHSAPYTDGSDDHIPSMQGFYVVGGSGNGTLHLDYDRHVRGTTRGSIVSGRMHAPERYAEDNEPEVAKFYFRGSRYDDRLIILELEDFTRGYDSGWDGEAWGGNDAAPMAYVSIDGRYDAVSAVPEYEGTVVGFRAGEDDEFTIDFVYDAEREPLYIYDTEERMYIRVLTGNAYHFTTNDKGYHERFILTRKAPYVITGFDQIDGNENVKAQKLLIENKMYILLNGLLYDATGKVVK